MVTEAELSAFLQAHGWYLAMSKRYQTRYAYAKKRVGKKVLSRYLKTEANLQDLTEEFVRRRIE